VCCALTHEGVIGTFLFDIITSSSSQDMLENVLLQLSDSDGSSHHCLTLQLGGAPFHFAHIVPDSFNVNLLG
jgi:hypothetical protein